MSERIIVFVTAGSRQEAEKIANQLVDEELVACVNLVETVDSIYKWQGKVCREKETLMIMKSVKTRLEQLITRVKTLHSYEVPEVIAAPIVAGAEDYLKWVDEQTAG